VGDNGQPTMVLGVLFGAGKQRPAWQPKVASSRMQVARQSFTCMYGKGDPMDRCSFGLCCAIKSPGQNSENLNLFPARCVLGIGSQSQVILLLKGSAARITMPFYGKINGTSSARMLFLGKGSFTS